MTLLLGLGASIDRSSPVLRSNSKAPNRTRSEEKVYMGTVYVKYRLRNCTNRLLIVENKTESRIKAGRKHLLKNQQLPAFPPISSKWHRCDIYTRFATAVNRTANGVKDKDFPACKGT